MTVDDIVGGVVVVAVVSCTPLATNAWRKERSKQRGQERRISVFRGKGEVSRLDFLAYRNEGGGGGELPAPAEHGPLGNALNGHETEIRGDEFGLSIYGLVWTGQTQVGIRRKEN